MKPVLAVTGTRREASVLGGSGVLAIAGGGDREHLAAEIDRLAPQCSGLLSFGMAGALSPQLSLGDWVVGTRVTGGWDGTCDEAFSAALAERLANHRHSPAQGLIHASDGLVSSAADKAALHAATGAIAADMESHVAGEAATRHGLGFAVLRCISDTADTDLPPAIAVAMKPGGGLALAQILGSILRHPGQLPALLRTARNFSRAFAVCSASGKRVVTGG